MEKSCTHEQRIQFQAHEPFVWTVFKNTTAFEVIGLFIIALAYSKSYIKGFVKVRAL